MKQISLEECKKIEFEILCYVADFCDKHGIEYMLAYGTLLGAVRHKGFIPWDDDIDLWMKRDEYDRLIEIFNKERNESSPYYLVSPYEKGAKHTYVKVINTKTVKKEFATNYKYLDFGVDIDIFPLDGLPSDEQTRKKWVFKLQNIYLKHFFKLMAFHGNISTRIKLLAKKTLMVFTSKNRLLNKAKKIHAEYPYRDAEYVNTMEMYFCLDAYPLKKEYFEGTVEVDFEGRKFKAPKNYHEVLTCTYGDYMTLPPEEERVTHHINQVFWK